MEMHQLRYMVAVARTGNFSRAARLCHVSQPSLSQQIQKLEGELGERLFERHRTRTRLTACGERFLLRAERILDEVEGARREAEDVRALAQGEVIVGVLPTIAPYFLPAVVTAFAQKYPGVSITLVEETTTALIGMMNRHEIDFALASLPIPDGQMEAQVLFEEELVLALPSGHKLARRRSIHTADLENLPFVLMREGHCLGDQVLRFCEQNQLKPKVRSRSAQMETILALVEVGQGVSLIPDMARRRSRDAGVVFRSLANPRPKRAVVALWHSRRPLHRAAAEFLDSCARHALTFQGGKIKNTAPINQSPA
jgi:LysR family hydrogen peroxide-inducible transcriptional activator